MALIDDAKQVVSKTFGPSNAAKVDIFAKEADPERYPKEFLEKCVALLASMLGPKLARDMLGDLFKRYQ